MWSLFWPVWSHDLFPGNLVTWSLSWQSGNVISFLSGHVISFLANLVTWSLSWPICSCDLFPGQSGHVVSFLANLVMWSLSWPRWSCDLFPIANLVTWSLSWTNLVTWSESYGKRLPACLKSDIQTSWATPPPLPPFPAITRMQLLSKYQDSSFGIKFPVFCLGGGKLRYSYRILLSVCLSEVRNPTWNCYLLNMSG